MAKKRKRCHAPLLLCDDGQKFYCPKCGYSYDRTRGAPYPPEEEHQ